VIVCGLGAGLSAPGVCAEHARIERARVNSPDHHDKALDLVEDVDAPHLLDAQRTRFGQGDFRGHGHAFRSRNRQWTALSPGFRGGICSRLPVTQ
jgi:hypothetical protein